MKRKRQNTRYIPCSTLAIVFVLFMTGMAHAQTVLDTPRQWISVEHIDLYSNQNLADTFNISVSATQVTLAYKGIERTFPVSNLEGNWTDIEQDGELSFHVQVLTLAGNGKLQREDGVLALVIDLSERKDWMKRKFLLVNPQ